MSNYTIISFATIDGKYDIFAYHFEENMKDLNIPYDLEYIEPVMPVKSNKRLLGRKRQKKDQCRIRGNFLQRKLKEHNSTIIWMDCDDGLTSVPELPKLNFDVGFIKNQDKHRHRLPIMARLLVLKPTDNAYHFLKVWDYLNSWPELEPAGGDHIRLCYARHISLGFENKNPLNFKEADLTRYFLPHLVVNMNRGKR